MNRYLLDSGLLYGFLDGDDIYHQSSVEIMSSIREPIILPVPAVTEVAHFVSKNLGSERLATFISALADTSLILSSPETSDYLRSAELIRKYGDSNIDFVDACIVAMAERLNITKILTVDRRHFQIFRPIHCKSFEIFP